MSMEHDHAQKPVQAMRPREAGPALDSPYCVLLCVRGERECVRAHAQWAAAAALN